MAKARRALAAASRGDRAVAAAGKRREEVEPASTLNLYGSVGVFSIRHVAMLLSGQEQSTGYSERVIDINYIKLPTRNWPGRMMRVVRTLVATVSPWPVGLVLRIAINHLAESAELD